MSSHLWSTAHESCHELLPLNLQKQAQCIHELTKSNCNKLNNLLEAVTTILQTCHFKHNIAMSLHKRPWGTICNQQSNHDASANPQTEIAMNSTNCKMQSQWTLQIGTATAMILWACESEINVLLWIARFNCYELSINHESSHPERLQRAATYHKCNHYVTCKLATRQVQYIFLTHKSKSNEASDLLMQSPYPAMMCKSDCNATCDLPRHSPFTSTIL